MTSYGTSLFAETARRHASVSCAPACAATTIDATGSSYTGNRIAAEGLSAGGDVRARTRFASAPARRSDHCSARAARECSPMTL